MQIRRGCPVRHMDFDHAVVECLMAGIAGVCQIGIGLGERGVVFGLNRAVELPERLLRNRVRSFPERKRHVQLDERSRGFD